MNKKAQLEMGRALAVGVGQKLCFEMRGHMEYTVLEKVFRKVGLDGEAVQNFSDKFKAHYPDWRLDSLPGVLGSH